jgi:asparaginyl-tRNA synthetase
MIVFSYLTQTLTERGFEWLSPVLLSKSTDPLWPDPGASIEKRVVVEIYGESFRAMQSMIIHKLVACSTLYPKLFILSPNIRVEKRERKDTGLHAYEFTQVDFEMREAGFEEIRRLVEELMVGLISHLRNDLSEELLVLGRYDEVSVPRVPFQVHDRENLFAKYGSDWEKELPTQ